MEGEVQKKGKGPAPGKGPVTVKLSEPIEWGDDVIKELVLKRPKAKHVKNMDIKNPRIADMLGIAAKLSGHSTAVLDELCTEDMNKVLEAVGELL